MTVHTYRIGWRSSASALARSLYVPGIPAAKRPETIAWAWGRLRHDLARLRTGGHRCGGWHAEPDPMPPNVSRIGCAWTRRGALRDLGRHLVEALDPPAEHLGRAVVPDGYAQGRADLQLVHRPTRPRETHPYRPTPGVDMRGGQRLQPGAPLPLPQDTIPSAPPRGHRPPEYRL